MQDTHASVRYLFQVLQELLSAFTFMGLAATYIPGTILHLVKNHDWASLTSWSKFQYAWFASFWATVAPLIRDSHVGRVVPLLQGRVRAGAIIEPGVDSQFLSPGVGGTVIEIGPGSGNWVSMLSDKYVSPSAQGAEVSSLPGQRTTVTKAYGIEPNADHHAGLATKIKEAGLEGRYQIVPVGIEDIASAGFVEKESVDAIVTLLCLCSIPEPEKNTRALYQYLKPGGRWYVFEHCVTFKKQGLGMELYQRLLNIFWPTFMGGCQLCRDTTKTLREAGKWKDFDLAMPVDEPWYYFTPHTYGILTKAE